MEVTKEFMVDGDRTHFDFEACCAEDGWAQIDTEQDDRTFGQWANPHRWAVTQFVEGEVIRKTFDSAEAFAAEVEQIAWWHARAGEWRGIDCRWSAHERAGTAEAFEALGLGPLLRTDPQCAALGEGVYVVR